MSATSGSMEKMNIGFQRNLQQEHNSNLMRFQYTSTGQNAHTTINNTKHPQYNHTISHNIHSQTKFNLNTMVFLGETSSQTIANSRLAFIFPNGSITHNQTSVYFQSPTPTPMQVPNDCSFETLKSRMHDTLQLTNNQLVDEIYYRQPFIDADQQCFFQSL